MIDPRVVHLGPCGGNNWGGGALQWKRGILSSVSKCRVKCYPNLVRILIMGRRWIFYRMVPVVPMGAQGAKLLKFQMSPSPDPEVQSRTIKLYVDIPL